MKLVYHGISKWQEFKYNSDNINLCSINLILIYLFKLSGLYTNYDVLSTTFLSFISYLINIISISYQLKTNDRIQ